MSNVLFIFKIRNKTYETSVSFQGRGSATFDQKDKTYQPTYFLEKIDTPKNIWVVVSLDKWFTKIPDTMKALDLVNNFREV